MEPLDLLFEIGKYMKSKGLKSYDTFIIDLENELIEDMNKSDKYNFVEFNDSTMILPKVEKPIKVKFDYGKCPECGFDLTSYGCLRCMNKEFIDNSR